MATIQIRGVQIQDESIEAAKINLSGSFDFRAATQFIAATPSADSDVATKGYVDAQIPDSLQGGDGIAIDTSTSPDTISVDLVTSNPSLQFSAGKLDVKADSTFFNASASGLQLADGAVSISAKLADNVVVNAKIADGTIANAKLANSTISGVALGSNLSSLSAGNGLSMTSYNGSAAVSDLTIDLDGATLAVGASGIKVADGGIAAGQIATDAVIQAKIQDGAVVASKIGTGAVETAKIADDAVTDAKISFEGAFDIFSPDGSTAAFNLSSQYLNGFEPQVMAFKNGLLMRLVQSSPADADQYTVTDNGSVSTVTFGANLSADDTLEVRYIAQKSA